MIPALEFLIPCGDWNGHVGSTGSGYKEVHGGYGYGKPDPDSEGERILEYALDFFVCKQEWNKPGPRWISRAKLCCLILYSKLAHEYLGPCGCMLSKMCLLRSICFIMEC